MNNNTFKFLLIFFILLLTSCKSIQYQKVETLNTNNKSKSSKIVEYFIDKEFNTNSINCIVVGKIYDNSKSNDFKNLNKSELIRKSLFGFLSVKNYEDIKLSRVNHIIKKHSPTSNTQLLNLLNCDAIITGEITNFTNKFYVSYSVTTVEINLKLVNKSSKILWSAKHKANSEEGSVPLSPLSLISGFFEASVNRQDESAFQMIDSVSRRLMTTLPNKNTESFNTEIVNSSNLYNDNLIELSNAKNTDPETMIKKGNFEKALKISKNLINNSPNSSKNYFYASKSEFMQKNYSSSIDYGLKAISKGYNNYEIYSILGSSYLKKEKINLAFASFDFALQLDPNISLTNYNFGIINEIQKNWKIASDSYYKSGLLSINENNKIRLYKSLKSLNRLKNKNSYILNQYFKLNQITLKFLQN